MSKLQSLWFRHDFNASNDEKIVRLLMKKGVAGYGVYWLLIEELAKADNLELFCSYDELAYKLHIEEESLVKSVVEDFGLFVVRDGKFFAQRLRSDMEEVERAREKRSNAGKKGGGNPNFKKGQSNPYYTKEINNVNAEDKQEINNVNAEDKQIRIRREEIEIRQDKTQKREERGGESGDNAVANGASTTGAPPIVFSDILSLWNATCTSLAKVQKITEDRRKKIKARWGEFGNNPMETLKQIFTKIQASDFCIGKSGGRGWKASFDWVFENSQNWVKVIEGNYDNNKSIHYNQGDSVRVQTEKHYRPPTEKERALAYLHDEEPKMVEIELGEGEWVDKNGRRTYGTGRFTVPNDAPPRPSGKHVWVDSDHIWTIL